MELREFVSQALADIFGGIEDAQKRVQSGCIVPEIDRTYKTVAHGISEIQAVQFEVTVKADSRSGSEAKLNVVAAIVGGGVKGESGKSGGHAATLKFSIPVQLPTGGPPKGRHAKQGGPS